MFKVYKDEQEVTTPGERRRPRHYDASGLNAIDLAGRKNHTRLAHLMEAHIDKKLSLEATKTEIEPLYTVEKVADLLSVNDTFVLNLIKTRKRS